MTILFPNHPLKWHLPDPDYETEFQAAESAGFRCELFSLESLRERNITAALRPCATANVGNEPLVHRCWMMSDELFHELHQGLAAKGYCPSTSPEQYGEAHYLPVGYRHIESRTPETR